MIYYSFIFRAEKRGESEWDEKWEVNIQWYMQQIVFQSLLPWNCLSKIDLNYAKYAANYFVDQNRKLFSLNGFGWPFYFSANPLYWLRESVGINEISPLNFLHVLGSYEHEHEPDFVTPHLRPNFSRLNFLRKQIFNIFDLNSFFLSLERRFFGVNLKSYRFRPILIYDMNLWIVVILILLDQVAVCRQNGLINFWL